MTFFYDLNKKLDSIREKPEVTHGQLNERDMSRAAKGYEKYGKQGMEALAKAGREGRALDPVRAKYDKYDEGIEDRIGDLDMTNPVNQPTYQRKAAAQGGSKKDFPRFSGGAPAPEMPKSHEGFPRFSGEKPKQVKEKMNPAKAKSFAALAEPKDKITFADKIAGAKKEVDEMLGDVAAEAMKNALSGGQKKLDKNDNGKLDANDFAMLRKGGGKAPEAKVSRHSTLKKVSNTKSGLSGYAPNDGKEMDEGWDDMMKDAERRRSTPKIGSITHGSKHDVEEIPGGRRVTRRTDPNTGYSVGADDDTPADGEKRGRGRPKGTKAAIGAKGPSGRSKLMNKEASHDEDPNVAKAKAILKKAGYTVSKAGEEELEEKAVSKKQQRFMGMVHATQKGEKAPSREVAKVAKGMGKKDAEDFAATKHKGLPEKKKSDDAPKKKKEKTEEAGGVGTPTASSGFGFGKGIYDSLNRELESMIAEGMNVNMSMNTDANGGPSKSLTVTATDDDALKLGKLLKMAGLGNGGESGYGGSGYQSACGCGTPNCSCSEVDEAYGDTTPTENAADYPTNTETSADALQYSGGLNKPKSTGQSTVPVLASQEERQESYAEAEEDALHRMMEMAGIKEAEHTILATYRVKDPGLIELLSNESGAEMDVMDGPDGDVGILTVDTISFPALSRMASKLAAEKKIQPIAGPATRDMTGKARTVGTKYIQSPDPVSEIAGQPASGMGAQVGDMIDYVNPNGEEPPEELVIQSGVQYDPDTKVISVPNSTQMADLHRKIEAAGWKKQTAGVRPNPMAGRQAQVAGDVPYQLGEEDDLARMMEMAGVKKKTDEEKTEEGNLFTGNLAKARADGKKEADLDGDGKMEKVDEGILAATANLWKEYKGQYGV